VINPTPRRLATGGVLRIFFVVTKLRVPLLISAAMSLLALAPSVASAQTTPRCSKTLIHDWYADGQIGGRYRVSCYRAALAEVPKDEIVYGTLKTDVSQALSSGIHRVKRQGVPVASQTLLPAPGGRVALPASPSRSESHSVLVFVALASLSTLLVVWFVVRLRNFRSPR
jgi:hypothetical protein